MGRLHVSTALLCHNFGKGITRSVHASHCTSIGMSAPGEVTVHDSFKVMDFLKSDKTNCSSRALGPCYVKHCRSLCLEQG